nr:CGNR zinc finger domain-containing protein [uncultured Actinoplanes sp.]
MTTVEVMPLSDLVDLVNEWGTRPREKNGRPPAEGQLTTLADEIHAVFAEGSGRAGRLTALLRQSGVRPEMAEESGSLDATWAVDDPDQRLRAAAALALRHHLAEHPGRLGVCADTQCADVYVDASPAGRRRFCCLTCQNRARAAAFRRRHRTADPSRAQAGDELAKGS